MHNNPFSTLFGGGGNNNNNNNNRFNNNTQSNNNEYIPPSYTSQNNIINNQYQNKNQMNLTNQNPHYYHENKHQIINSGQNSHNNYQNNFNQQPQTFNNKRYDNINSNQNNVLPKISTSQLPQYNTTINIQNLSPKQLLCQCIDLATQMFKQLTDSFISINNLPSPYQGKKVIDFSLLANYMLQPGRLDKILTQFITTDDQSIKSLVKSWIFQMKYIRNLWAHSQKVTYRLACRGYDTLGLLFESFGGDTNSALFQKIQTYRKALLIVQAKSGFN